MLGRFCALGQQHDSMRMQRQGEEGTAVLAASLGLLVMLLAKSGKSQGVGDGVPGSASEEAAILQMRADLMADLRKLVKAKKLTQAQAAKLLGVGSVSPACPIWCAANGKSSVSRCSSPWHQGRHPRQSQDRRIGTD